MLSHGHTVVSPCESASFIYFFAENLLTLLPLTIHAANSKSDNMSERLTAETAEYARNMQVKPFKTVGIS